MSKQAKTSGRAKGERTNGGRGEGKEAGRVEWDSSILRHNSEEGKWHNSSLTKMPLTLRRNSLKISLLSIKNTHKQQGSTAWGYAEL